MIKGVTLAHLQPIWYHLKPSNVPYSQNQFLGLDFCCCFLQQTGSNILNPFWSEGTDQILLHQVIGTNSKKERGLFKCVNSYCWEYIGKTISLKFVNKKFGTHYQILWARYNFNNFRTAWHENAWNYENMNVPSENLSYHCASAYTL